MTTHHVAHIAAFYDHTGRHASGRNACKRAWGKRRAYRILLGFSISA